MNHILLTKKQSMAVFYMLAFSLVTTFIALKALSLLGLSSLLTTKTSLLTSSLIAISLGLMKNQTLIRKNISTKKAFLIGVLLFLMILPLFDISAVFMMQSQFSDTTSVYNSWSDYLTLYMLITLYSFVFIGSWLSIISGIMFVAFNKFILTRTTNSF